MSTLPPYIHALTEPEKDQSELSWALENNLDGIDLNSIKRMHTLATKWRDAPEIEREFGGRTVVITNTTPKSGYGSPSVECTLAHSQSEYYNYYTNAGVRNAMLTFMDLVVHEDPDKNLVIPALYRAYPLMPFIIQALRSNENVTQKYLLGAIHYQHVFIFASVTEGTAVERIRTFVIGKRTEESYHGKQ